MSERNKHRGWVQGTFIDQRQYDHLSDEWKEERRIDEALLVRPAPLGNAICRAASPEDAAWIAKRLNAAAERDALQARVAELEGAMVEARAVMRATGWHLALSGAPVSEDGVLEAACVEVESKFQELLIPWPSPKGE